MHGWSGSRSALARFGVRPVINASGIYTDLGGSIMSPEIMSAWAELNLDWVRMTDLLDGTGAAVAELLDVPGARITPSASAAIALATAACMTGDDGRRWEQLPGAPGERSEILLQGPQLERYKYDLCVKLPGATLTAAPPAGLAAAIGARTAALFHVAHLDGCHDTLPLEKVAAVAREAGIPVIVDAAYYNFPLMPDHRADLAFAARDTMRAWHARGGDLVCFSAKYFWGPNAGGFVMGRRDLIDTVGGLDFTRYESGPFKAFGRAFKMGRFEIVATVLALEAWLRRDHRIRLETYRGQVDRFADQLAGVPDVDIRPVYFTLDERWIYPEDEQAFVNAATVRFDGGRDAATIAAVLAEGDPRILPFVEDGLMTVVMETVRPGDERRIADAILAALA